MIAACHAAREYAQQIGYDMPTFNGDEIVRMVNTLMINGNGKNGGSNVAETEEGFPQAGRY